MRELNPEEIALASGGVGPAGGAALGAASYMMGVSIGATEFQWSGLAGASVAGAASFGISAIGAGAVASSLYGGAVGAATLNAGQKFEAFYDS